MTGEISNLVVLDIDPNHGGDASVGRLERQLAPLPVTVQATTGGGGRHLYFAHPGGLVRNRAGLAQASMCVATAATSSRLPQRRVEHPNPTVEGGTISSGQR